VAEHADKNPLVVELQRLQRGRGLQLPPDDLEIGPNLNRKLNLEQAATAQGRQDALTKALIVQSSILTPELRLVFSAASALRVEDLPNLEARISKVAERLGVSGRTVKRRLEIANKKIAARIESLAVASKAPSKDWVLNALHTRVDLTTSRPIFEGLHQVTVTSPFLDTFSERISFPGATADADPEFLVSGDCKLVSVTRPFPVTWEVTMSMQSRKLAGDQAQYAMTVKVPSRRLIHPMSVMLPERECHTFTTEVNFGAPSVAKRAWRFDGVSAPVAQLEELVGTEIDLTAQPVVRAGFRNMVLGRVYGLRWEWADELAKV
jgi:predicted DNA-binding protein (UPF0251 family)